MPKRSVFLNGRKTSVSLEAQFWDCIKGIAAREALTVSGLISRIDRERSSANLSSTLRLFVLEDVRAHIDPGLRTGGPAHSPGGA